MNIITLLQDFRALIHQDAALQAWSQLHYGDGVQSYIGVDERNPPAPGLPEVHLFPISKRTGLGVESKSHQVGLTCGIYDDGESVLVYDSARELQAVARLEEFRVLVLAAVRQTTIDGLLFQAIETEYETVEYFPNFFAVMALTIEQPGEFRADPYE